MLPSVVNKKSSWNLVTTVVGIEGVVARAADGHHSLKAAKVVALHRSLSCVNIPGVCGLLSAPDFLTWHVCPGDS